MSRMKSSNKSPSISPAPPASNAIAEAALKQLRGEAIGSSPALAPSPASLSAASTDREDRRDSVMDRRVGVDRRDFAPADDVRASESPSALSTNLERRRGPGRRRTDFMKCADEGEMTPEQFLFIMAIDAFKRVNGKTFPTWTDVLEVIRKLGYRKTMPSELKNLGANTEDWTERADAPAGVFKPAEED